MLQSTAPFAETAVARSLPSATVAPTEAPPARGTVALFRGCIMDTVFRHGDHTRYACVRCHSQGAVHGQTLISAPADCRACHHSLPVAQPCSSCHRDEAASSRAFEVLRTLTLPGGATPVRALPFASAVAEFGMLLRDTKAAPERWTSLGQRLRSLPVVVEDAADRQGFVEMVELAAGLRKIGGK